MPHPVAVSEHGLAVCPPAAAANVVLPQLIESLLRLPAHVCFQVVESTRPVSFVAG